METGLARWGQQVKSVVSSLIALTFSLLASVGPDPRALAILRDHHWLYLDQVRSGTRLEVQTLDPWAEASWWDEAQDPLAPHPIWGFLWDQQDRLQQVLPNSAADRAGITEDNLTGMVDTLGRIEPVSDQALQGKKEVVFVLRDGSRCAVAQSIWSPPTLWLTAKGTARIYSFSQDAGVLWQQVLPRLPKPFLDLRGCRGGFTEPALQILGTFLGPDCIVAHYQSRDEFGRLRRSLLKTPSISQKILEPRDWTVLVDRHTASAGELVALALGSAGAEVQGGPTFGKHCTQDQITLPDGSWIRFTVGVFTPP